LKFLCEIAANTQEFRVRRRPADLELCRHRE
jgi:hypothetical protein